MKFIPIGLNTEGKDILILGGGFMALSALKKLIDSEADIYIIGSDINEEIKKIAKNNEDRVFIKEEELDESFVFMGYDFLFIATDNFELNSSIEKLALRKKMLYERMDILNKSTMNLNSAIEKGPVIIGVNNSKLNPTITDIVYEDIKKIVDGYSEEKFNILTDIRQELLRKNAPDIDKKIRELYREEVISLKNIKDDLVKENVKAIDEFEKEAATNEFTENSDKEDIIIS